MRSPGSPEIILPNVSPVIHGIFDKKNRHVRSPGSPSVIIRSPASPEITQPNVSMVIYGIFYKKLVT